MFPFNKLFIDVSAVCFGDILILGESINQVDWFFWNFWHAPPCSVEFLGNPSPSLWFMNAPYFYRDTIFDIWSVIEIITKEKKTFSCFFETTMNFLCYFWAPYVHQTTDFIQIHWKVISNIFTWNQALRQNLMQFFLWDFGLKSK